MARMLNIHAVERIALFAESVRGDIIRADLDGPMVAEAEHKAG